MLGKVQKDKKGCYSVTVAGELNMQSVPVISKQLSALLPHMAAIDFTLDFSSVSHSDSAGVALLVEIMRLSKKAKISLLFSNLPQQMQDIATIGGLIEILPIEKRAL